MTASTKDSIFSSLNLQDVDVLCLYGAESHLYESLLLWLEENEDRFLVFFLEGGETFFSFFATSHPRVRRYGIEGNIEEVCKQISWEFVFLRCHLWSHPDVAPSERFQNLLKVWKEMQWGVHLVASDYQDFGATVLKNVRNNLKKLQITKDFSQLKNRFSKIPAIICGAGPSLTQNMSLLKDLTQNALIFGGGSSLTALSAFSVPFHFGASIDPDPSYTRFFESSAFEIPFFYQDRLSDQILSLVHAPELRVPGSGGYALEQWFCQELGLEEPSFDGGWTVATFCAALSCFLGCDPIIFVGMDFSYGDPSHVYGAGLREPDASVSLEEQEKFSKKDWIMAVKWLEDFAKSHADRLFLNASLGGLEMQGISACFLQEAAGCYLQSSYDLKGHVHAVLEQLPQKSLKEEKKKSVFQSYETSFKRCEEILSRILKIVEKYYPDDPRGKGEFILGQYDLYEEIVYQKILEPLWSIWKYVLERKQSLQAYGGVVSELLFFKKILQAHKR